MSKVVLQWLHSNLNKFPNFEVSTIMQPPLHPGVVSAAEASTAEAEVSRLKEAVMEATEEAGTPPPATTADGTTLGTMLPVMSLALGAGQMASMSLVLVTSA